MRQAPDVVEADQGSPIFARHGGEMARRMSRVDWSGTSLGAPEPPPEQAVSPP
jgi:hypothetical protein